MAEGGDEVGVIDEGWNEDGGGWGLDGRMGGGMCDFFLGKKG